MNLRSNRGEERRSSKTALISKGEEEGRGTPTSTPSLKGREAAQGFPVLQQSSGQASPARSGCIPAFWGLPNPLVRCGSRCSRTLHRHEPDTSTCDWSTSNPPAPTSHRSPAACTVAGCDRGSPGLLRASPAPAHRAPALPGRCSRKSASRSQLTELASLAPRQFIT